MLRAGDLKFRVTIMRPVRSESAKSNASVPAFVTVREIWAGIRPLSSREQANYAGVQLLATHMVTTRYTPDITGDCRLVHAGRTFHIVGAPINVDNLGAELRMTVSEQT